jgi:signal transduction histidine kinase
LAGLILVLWLLVRAYRNSYSAVTKRQVGMVTLCGFVAGVPLLTLSIFPGILFGEALLPVPFALLFLIALPLGYGYAIGRYQFIQIERYVSRSVTAVYVIGTLCILYFGISYLLRTLSDDNVLANPLVNLLMVMTLVVAYNPLYRRLRNLVDYLLYGGWYDYPTVVRQVTHTLESTTGIETIAQTLTMSVQKTMRVNWVYLLWQEAFGTQTSIYASENTENPFSLDILRSNGLPNIIHFLKEQTQPMSNRRIRREAADWELTDEETQLIESGLVRLWVPIQGLENSLGLLILGPKYGGDLFNAEDMEILEVVSRQASVIFQNAQLIGELEEKVDENEQYQKEIIRAREEERKRIARELHDQIIQQLVGLKYHMVQIETASQQDISNGNGQQGLDLESEIGALIEATRHLCQDLRPAALDLGLIPTIRSLTNRFEMDHKIGVNLTIEGDRTIPIGEDVALCLFRCTGEALSNIRKHAAATQIDLDLTIQPDQVSLTICDNGVGFEIPQRLGSLMNNNHFGLVGMRERVELLQGTFAVTSAPERGTRLEVSIPFSNQLPNHIVLEENHDRR